MWIDTTSLLQNIHTAFFIFHDEIGQNNVNRFIAIELLL